MVNAGEGSPLDTVSRIAAGASARRSARCSFAQQTQWLARQKRADFFSLPLLADVDVARLVPTIRVRVLGFLKRRGKLDHDTAPSDDPATLEVFAAAAVQGCVPLGPHVGAYDPRLGRGAQQSKPRPTVPLCASMDGFSLHAKVRIPDGRRERLEQRCRYAARPPLVDQRLAFADHGDPLYLLKKKFRDGSTPVVLEPHTLIARLAALIPRPCEKLTTYPAIFAPAAAYRGRVVAAAQDEQIEGAEPAPTPMAPAPPQTDVRRKPRKPRKGQSWAELLRRVYRIDVLLCSCGGKRSLIAAITERGTIVTVLAHLGLPTEAPRIAQARAAGVSWCMNACEHADRCALAWRRSGL